MSTEKLLFEIWYKTERNIRISMGCLGEKVAKFNETPNGINAELYIFAIT